MTDRRTRQARTRSPGAARTALHIGTAMALALGIYPAGIARAWDSPRGQMPVPEHRRAWVEATGPGLHSLFLWKFSTDDDTPADPFAVFEADMQDLIAAGEASRLAMPETDREPRLRDGAHVVTDAGRFGGGLVLDGSGSAYTALPYRSLLHTEGGFTLDLWFRRDASPPMTGPETLLLIPDADRQPLLVVRLEASAQSVALLLEADTKLTVPLEGDPAQWHHLVLAVAASSGRATEVTLIVDRHGATDEDPFWLSAAASRLGQTLSLGGAPRQPGLRGVIDEVHLQRGRRYFYRRGLYLRQRPPETAVIPVAPPYFRNDDVLLRLPFDGTLEPAVGPDVRLRGEAGPRMFRRGIRGQALDMSRIDATGFAIDNTDLFPNLTGTVEFWMRPLDWNNFYVGDYHGRDVQSMVLLGLRPPDALRYGHDARSRPTQSIRVALGRSGGGSGRPWTKLHPGEWTHVLIAAWGRDRRQNAVYLNGRRAGHVTMQFHDSLRGHARRDDDRFGPGELGFEQTGTLIDEFSVYPWTLNADEAWNAYARWLPDAEDHLRALPAFDASFSYAAHAWDNRERLDMRISWLPIDGVRPAGVEAILRDAQGNVLHTSERQALDITGNTRFRAYQALPFGRYTAEFRAYDADDRLLGTEQAEYERVRPDWYANTLGLERTVPAPWTPMRVEGTSIHLWGRELRLGPDGLPAHITTLGVPILDTPVAITVSGPSGTATLRGTGVTFTETAADRVAWRATLEGGGIRAELEAALEFDGLLTCTITLRPGDADRIATLHIDFPMEGGHTRQLIANGGGRSFRGSWVARMIPDGTGRVWDGLTGPGERFGRALKNFLPHVWLGGDVAGLYFGGDNDQGWTVNDELDSPAQEVRRHDGRVVYRMNVIREPTTIAPDGHRFHFATLPTPAKPEPEDWRQRLRGEYGSVRYWFGAMDVFGGVSLNEDPENPGGGHSALEPVSWEHAMVESAFLREKWGMTILMANSSYPGPREAFRDWNHDMWAGTGRVAWTPEFVDYAVWAVNEYLRRDVIDGIYIDDVSVGRTFSLASTGYELPDGTRRLGFTALAQRRFLMRLWRLFQQHGKTPDIGLHMTYCYEVPMFSFARYLFNGEVFDGANYRTDRSFMDVWPPELLRILGNAAKWGTGQQWVTHGVGSSNEHWAYAQNRALHGNYMATDVLSETVPGSALLREGLLAPGVQAYPFWHADKVLELALEAAPGANVVGTVYAHQDRAFVQVTNYEYEEHAVTLKLREGAIFPAGELIWRDIDPNLEPPAQRAASRAEIERLAETRTADTLFGAPGILDDDMLEDLLDDSTPEERAMQRWTFDPKARPVRLVVRPRDYRILEVRPAGR